jgi:Type II intron maturase/Reverse transcriptase (RNA-dependent DNA polymerase)
MTLALLRIFAGLSWSEELGEYRIRDRAGNKHGILHMCASRRLPSAAGEIQKTFCTLLGKENIELATNIKVTSKFDNKIEKKWINNDNKLFERAVSVEALKRAWFSLKSKPGMSTRGSDFETLSGISEAWFTTTSGKLLKGTFKYPNRRRVPIDKPDSGIRPLTIANPRIKIIERALLNALEPQFEGSHVWDKIDEKEYQKANNDGQETNPDYKIRVVKNEDPVYLRKRVISPCIFFPHNYGSRPNKSAHEALHNIKKNWRTNTNFLIDYDISKAFENINRKRLKNLFCAYIKDIRFWFEISKLLNAGVLFELQVIFEHKKVAQGSILSPFLFNIYMHELDKKVVNLQKLTSSSHKSHESVTYGNKEAEMEYRKISRDFATDNLRRALKKYGSKKAVLGARKRAYKEHHDKYGRRKGIDNEVRHIQYVRYVNDFLIGIVGSRKFATQVRKDINNFIKGNLHLNVKKDNLIHRNDGPVKFLSHLVGLPEFKVKTSAVPKAIRAARKHKNSSIARFLATDKRLARAKSYEFQANILKQVRNLSKKMKTNISKQDQNDSISSILAFKELGTALKEELALESWDQLVELMLHADSLSGEAGETRNKALDRWIAYLQNEGDRLNEFCANILRDKITSIIKLNWTENLSRGNARKVEAFQSDYLEKAEEIIKETFNEVVEKKRNSVIKKFNIKANPGLPLSDDDKELIELAEELALQSAIKASPRRISVNAPISEVFAKLRLKGYIHPIKDRAVGNLHLGFYTDSEIITHYNSVIRSLLQWFSGADNLSKIKGLAQLLRKSCVLTLANKHKKSSNWIYTVYGSEIKINSKEGKGAALVTRSEILNSHNKFNLKTKVNALDHFSTDNIIGRFYKLNHSLEFFEVCCVTDCHETEGIEVHHIRRLHRRVNKNGMISVLSRDGKRVTGLAAVLTSLNRKQIPLCHKHHLDFEAGRFHPLDYSKISSVLNRNSTTFKISMPKDGDFKPIFDGKDYTLHKKPSKKDELANE